MPTDETCAVDCAKLRPQASVLAPPKYMQRTTSGAAGNGLYTTIKYLRGAASIGLGTTIKYLRHTTSAAANNGLGTAIKYLLTKNAGAGKTGPRGPTYRGGLDPSKTNCD
jgi:hypothetical protein